jgi:cell division protein FtsI (penicillin-binding protein 3)
MDPNDGAVLAMASVRADPRATAATALSEPFEPGSAVKPFVAAKLLELKRADPDEVVNTEWGTWTFNGRTITDVHKAEKLTMRDVLRFSSNIGIAKLALRLAPREQYEMLRDLGFGAPTGVPYPAEASGRLYAPSRWSKTTPASLAIGYELSVTPIQLAAAYSAIANGGNLVEPSLVREIRDADGAVRYHHERRVVRRVMPAHVAATVREMLKSVVDSGTATDAEMASFDLGGKSGTVRRTEPGRRGYVEGRYNAVFAGIFPIESPQYAIVVKVENPSGVYYGGKVAAPLAKAVLEGAIATKNASLDKLRLTEALKPKARDAFGAHDTARPAAVPAGAESASAPRPAVPDWAKRDTVAAAVPAPVRYVVDLPAPARGASPPLPPREVPAVQGLPLRDAVFALHRAGFRVRVAPGGPAGLTAPAAGTSARPGDVVTLYRQR